MKHPFSDADVVLRMLQAYIRQKFLAQQDSFLDTPEIVKASSTFPKIVW